MPQRPDRKRDYMRAYMRRKRDGEMPTGGTNMPTSATDDGHGAIRAVAWRFCTTDNYAASSWVSRLACQLSYASSNLIVRISCSNSVRLMFSHLLTDYETGQITCYKPGQFICSLHSCIPRSLDNQESAIIGHREINNESGKLFLVA
jgi:hypothetical protein